VSYRGILSLFFVFVSTLFGVELRRRLRQRVHSLLFIRDYLRLIKSYASHTGMNFRDIVFSCVTDSEYDGFIMKIRELISHNSFAFSFRRALDLSKTSFCLTDNDYRLLVSLVDQLGGFGLDDLLSRFDLADEELSSLIERLSGKVEKEGRLSVVVGVCVGGCAALLFF
jgi:Stage III sporulation protein AB (spore_III_AB).